MRYFFVIDFNLQQTSDICRESGYAYREIGVRSINGASAIAYIPTVRSQVSKPISNAHVFTSRSVPLPGLRTTDLPRESAQHRNLSACPPSQTRSLGHPRQYSQEHTGRGNLGGFTQCGGIPHPQPPPLEGEGVAHGLAYAPR